MSPPIPNVVSAGSSFLSSRTTCAAWRSPEASPATIASFKSGAPSWSADASSAHPSHADEDVRTPTEYTRALLSSQWQRIHRPPYGNSAEEQRDEDPEKEADALARRALPQQSEKRRGCRGVEKHQDEVRAKEAHSFLPAAMSWQSRTSRRFISPAVSVNAVPYSNVIDVMSPRAPACLAMK